MAGLVLSDGNRSLDLVGTPPDGIYLVEFEPPIIGRENTYAQGADSEYGSRVRTRPTGGGGGGNPGGSGKLRIDRVNDTAADFYDDLDNLQELVESAHRRKGTLAYTPPDGEEVTFDLESIVLSGIPQDGRALSRRRCEPTFEFECRPYGRLAPRTIFTSQAITGPIGELELTDIRGHVDALAELTITDTATQACDHLEVGLEQDGYDSGSPAPLVIDSDSMTALAGAAATQSGAYDPNASGNNVIRATLTSTPVAICSTGAQPHVGRKRIRVSVYGSTADIRVRLSWRVAEGPFTAERWVALPGANDFYDLDLEAITIAEVPSGTHSWEGYIEAYATSGTPTLDVDNVEVLPAEVYTKARAPLAAKSLVTPSVGFTAADEFDQTAGNLDAPKAARIGGNWAEAVRTGANGFQVETTGKTAQRTTVSDADGNSGSYATVGSTVAACGVQVDLKFAVPGQPGSRRLGLLARYVDSNNWLMGVLNPHSLGLDTVLGRLEVYKRVSGTVTQITTTPPHLFFGIRDTWHRLLLTADARGNWALYWNLAPNSPVLALSGNDPVLATGGTLDDGKLGIYDAHPTATADTRNYDNFAGWALEVDHVIHSGRKAKLLSNANQRQNSDGTRYGKVPVSEGQYLRIPPSTRAGIESRLAIKRRRLDVDGGLPNRGLTDGATVDLTVTERVVLSGEP